MDAAGAQIFPPTGARMLATTSVKFVYAVAGPAATIVPSFVQASLAQLVPFALAATTYASTTTIICDQAVSGSSACNSGAPGAANTVQISTVLSLDSAVLANPAFAPTLAGALNAAAAGAGVGATFTVLSVVNSTGTTIYAAQRVLAATTATVVLAVTGPAITSTLVTGGIGSLLAGVVPTVFAGATAAAPTILCDASTKGAACGTSSAFVAGSGASFCGNNLPTTTPAAADIACFAGSATLTSSAVATSSVTAGARYCGILTQNGKRTYLPVSLAYMAQLTASFTPTAVNPTPIIPYTDIVLCNTANCNAPASDKCAIGVQNTVQVSTVLTINSALIANATAATAFAQVLVGALNAAAKSTSATFTVLSITNAAGARVLSAGRALQASTTATVVLAVSGPSITSSVVTSGIAPLLAYVVPATFAGASAAAPTIVCDASTKGASCGTASPYGSDAASAAASGPTALQLGLGLGIGLGGGLVLIIGAAFYFLCVKAAPKAAAPVAAPDAALAIKVAQ